MTWARGDEALWTDAGGHTHRVVLTDTSRRSATIEYWDNSRRGDRYVAGRRYNHGTRVRVVVYQRELRQAG